jgi:ABC-type transporter Mla subunit MlaD
MTSSTDSSRIGRSEGRRDASSPGKVGKHYSLLATITEQIRTMADERGCDESLVVEEAIRAQTERRLLHTLIQRLAGLAADVQALVSTIARLTHTVEAYRGDLGAIRTRLDTLAGQREADRELLSRILEAVTSEPQRNKGLFGRFLAP